MPSSAESARERRALAGRAGIISLATMSSRVLGLLREHLFAKLFGAAAIADAFVIAFRIPNLLRELFAEGALSMAFVPTFTEYREKRTPEEAFDLARVVFTGLLVVVGGLCLLGHVFAPQIVDLIVPGFDDGSRIGDQDKRELTIQLTRIMMPFLLMAAWAALCRGILNTYHRFFLPALAPVVFNLSAVIVGYAMYFAGWEPLRAVYGWAIATLIGGALQFLIQVPSLHRLGWRLGFRFDWKSPGLRRILLIMGPATLGLAATQVNIFINSRIASDFGDGPVAMLNYAFRLIYLPIGVIGVALATVTTVQLSRDAARADLNAFAGGLSNSLRYLLFITIPGTAGLLIMAEPLVRLIFGYGEFARAEDATRETALGVMGYGWALAFFCGTKILVPAFYARNQIRIPVTATLCAVGVNLTWSLSTAPHFGWKTLAVGTALAALSNFTFLTIALLRHVPHFPWRALLTTLGKVIVLTIPMAAVAYGSSWGIDAWLGHETLWARLAGTIVPIVAAITTILGGAHLWGLEEVRALTRRAR